MAEQNPPESSTEVVYKIVDQQIWQDAMAQQCFSGAEIDLDDGFIHLSTANQIAKTIELFFSGRTNLLLVAIQKSALGDNLKWEKTSATCEYPHFYGSLMPDDVLWTASLDKLPAPPGETTLAIQIKLLIKNKGRQCAGAKS
jgi:uncharacterized protein (DUF952 family)